MGFRRWLVVLLALALAAAGFFIWTRPPQAASIPDLELLPATPQQGFARALQPLDLSLPRDHGPHPQFQTEWWYYTGNLAAPDGRRFAYQLTFFRRGLSPKPPVRRAELAADQIYFAHFALLDVQAGTHQEWERFSRGAAGLAGAQSDPLRIWLENWSAEGLNAEGSQIRLQAAAEAHQLDLELSSVKPLVAHGETGLSPKSAEAGNASYYLSYTRMRSRGELIIDGQPYQVEGESWFDHEWSTSALGPQSIGWDWFSLQLSDGREIMYFQIRQQDGSIEQVSSGTVVDVDGSSYSFESSQISIEVLDQWQSSSSGGRYPSRWRIQIPSAEVDLTIEPLLNDQEMNVSFIYWEGAVRVQGQSNGQEAEGYGFVELTGYADSMQGRF